MSEVVDNSELEMSVGPLVPLPAIVNAQAGFALDMLRQQSLNNSVIMSPISVSIALAMVYLGAKEETANQIKATIAKNATDDELHAHFSSLLSTIKDNELNVTLELANRVYVQKDFEILQTFIDGIQKYYEGEFKSVNFGENVEVAKEINTFVEEATHDKIKDLISADALNSLTRLVLVNAIYFKGDWNVPFKPERTTEADFYASPEETRKVQMMHMEDDFPYFATEDYQVLGLPYTGKKTTMYIILPRERFGLADLLKKLDGETLAQLLAKKGKSKVNVSLPKFKIESSFNLNDALKNLGIQDAFSQSADFTGIAEGGNIYVSDVVHKAFIETDERGTVAAAATGLVVQTMSLVFSEEFVADHGFIFVLMDEDQHCLFTGVHL